MQPDRSAFDRVMASVVCDVRTRCWEPRLTRHPAGYIWIWSSTVQRKAFAHRIVYRHLVGPIDAGLEIDHLCRNRACCNPAHLEAVTHRENALRGASMVAVNAKKTHCINGHALTPENVYDRAKRPRAYRECALCRRDRDNRYRAARIARKKASRAP